VLKRFASECVKKSKSTAVKVSGSIIGVSSVLSLILFLHSDLKAQIDDKVDAAQEIAKAQIAVAEAKIEANQNTVQIQFKAVQKTIDLQVKTVTHEMQSLKKGQTQVLKMLDKLDRRLYKMKSGG